jgi:hypothetical protein
VSGKLSIGAALASVLCLGLGVAWADLPNVSAPAEEKAPPPKQDDARADDQPNPNAAPNGLLQAKQPRPSAERKEQTIDLDLLMKAASDPKTPLSVNLVEQLRQTSNFARLPFEKKNQAVPELLGLLKNETPISAGDAPASLPVPQIRHRANAALATIAAVCFGQFPLRKAGEQLTAEQQAADAKAAEQLVALWNDWWQQAKDLDEAARKELSKKLRAGRLDAKDEQLLWVNVRFCLDEQDAAALPILREKLKDLNIRRTSAVETVSAYGSLCQAPGAPADAGLALVELVRKNNNPEVCRDMNAFMVLRMATVFLRRAAGTGLTPYLEAKEIEVEEGGEKRTVTVHMITEEAIKGWEEAIKAKAGGAAPKPADKPADDKNQAQPDEGHAPPRANLRIQIAPRPAPAPPEDAKPADQPKPQENATP